MKNPKNKKPSKKRNRQICCALLYNSGLMGGSGGSGVSEEEGGTGGTGGTGGAGVLGGDGGMGKPGVPIGPDGGSYGGNPLSCFEPFLFIKKIATATTITMPTIHIIKSIFFFT